MAVSRPQIAVKAEAEAEVARADVRSAPHLGTVSNDEHQIYAVPDALALHTRRARVLEGTRERHHL